MTFPGGQDLTMRLFHRALYKAASAFGKKVEQFAAYCGEKSQDFRLRRAVFPGFSQDCTTILRPAYLLLILRSWLTPDIFPQSGIL